MDEKNASSLKNLRGIVSFLSFSGCGQSLLSSMIDAHKNAVVSREELLLNKLYDGRIDKQTMFLVAIESSLRYTKRGRLHRGSNTSHLVPNQSNGASSDIHILGDKHGYGVVDYIVKHKDYLRKVQSLLGLPIYFIHVRRNPCDVIAHARKFDVRCSISEIAEKVSNRFIRLKAALERVGKGNYLTVSCEELVNNCSETLEKVLDFLHLSAYNGFIADCEKIVNKSKIFERNDVKWDSASERIATRLCQENGYAS